MKWEREDLYIGFRAGQSEGKKTSGRPMRTRVDEIYLLVSGMRGVEWIDTVRTGTSGGALTFRHRASSV